MNHQPGMGVGETAAPVDPLPGPPRSGLKLLCLGPNEPDWELLAAILNSSGEGEPRMRFAVSPAEALICLRGESFDCLLLDGGEASNSAEVDPFALVRSIRAAGCTEPIVCTVRGATDELWKVGLDLEVDLLVTENGWQTTALPRMIARAVARQALAHDWRRLSLAERRRQQSEEGETESILAEHWRIAGGRTEGSASVPPQAAAVEAAWEQMYIDLLKSHVMMSQGTLGEELHNFARMLAAANFTPSAALRMHLRALERLVVGLGVRSSRHLLARAHLLSLELVLLLAQ